ncbi:UNVERIFIED_CONTAM: Farnesyl pyrophosphate synthase [Sesamum radiatum]|uniref:Farnesyl pyrophosphate synthase n=1 Tax=Sesamum radiatum TaxID=300843 RepID=A0AAW2K4M2_SESRA
MANPNGSTSDLRTAFLRVYSVLKSDLLNDPAFEWTDASRQWVDRMLDYNVPGGKLNRGLSVVDSYKLLKEGKDLTEDEVFLASALGWCIEWLQAYFLVLDDIMDNSHTRRGQPCWFRVPKVGMIAVNDGIMLRNHIPRILKKHFRQKPYYVDLLDLFNEEHYGKADPADVAKIKALYNDINLQGVFVEYESKSYDRLTHSIDAHPSKAVQAVLKSFLGKIYKRQK